MKITVGAPLDGLEGEVVFGLPQLCLRLVLFGLHLGDPLLTTLQKRQLGTETHWPLGIKHSNAFDS